MIRLFILLVLMFQASSASVISLEDAKRNGMWETLQNYIKRNSVIVDICVYEQEWIPSSESFPKGQLIQSAVVTHTHCGSWKVGQQIEYTHYIEDPPRFFGHFKSTVPGTLRTFFYDPDGSELQKEGMLKIQGDGHWGFSRVGDVFADLFALELNSNPKLRPKRKLSVDQPATALESNSETKPESEKPSE